MKQQQGFWFGTSTTDGICIVKCIHQIIDKMKKSVDLLLIDLAAVFSNRVRDSMFKTVCQRLIPTSNMKLTQLMESLYLHNWIVNKHLFMGFVAWVFLDKCTDIGIKFIQLKYRIPASATHPKRITVGQHYLDSVGYAEDLVLLFEDITNLELALDVLSATFKRYQLETNISETKMMIFNQYLNEKYPKPIVSINNILVENTIIFEYLGCNMKNDKPPIRESELEITLIHHNASFMNVGKNWQTSKSCSLLAWKSWKQHMPSFDPDK